ncbi:hypothetical protein L2D14_17085 [Thalassospiraceae bacterium LMO-JJ14]|nr:hypothetical protein L2D14_17085 [Thalassospiraceae bacterium LMO-JJ14]
MNKVFAAPIRYLLQACVYAGFALILGYFSQAPAYLPIAEGEAQIKFSFAHGGKPKGGCRDRTAAELGALAANMRKAQLCSRERVDVVVYFELDGKTVFQQSLPPSGLRGDGPSHMYEKFDVPAGRHEVLLKLRNTTRSDGWDYQAHRTIALQAGQILAIDFDPGNGGFVMSDGGG